MTDPGCYNTPDDLAPAPDPEPPPDADLRLSSPELLISYTLFRDTSAMSPIERADVPWPTLVAHLKAAPIYAGKAHCPLISLSEYGDKPSPKGSLRHAANVLRCCGAELD